jgi:hypothetical protein
MNHWTFVTAAYGVTLGATVAVTLWAWASMRAAERAAQK